MSEFVCEHVPLNKQAALSVIHAPCPQGCYRVECPCCHLPGYMDVDDADPEPNCCPYCGVEAVPQ